MVMNTKRVKIESKRKNLVQHLINLEPWIQGTVVKTDRICGSKVRKGSYAMGTELPSCKNHYDEDNRGTTRYYPFKGKTT